MKRISIFGDSISTYEGFNPDGYSVYYDETINRVNGLNSVEDTWWARVIKACSGQLCVNGSYSGSMVTGLFFPAGASEKRCCALNTETSDPDMILVYMGFNDLACGVLIKHRVPSSTPDPKAFFDAYGIMLDRLKTNYPNAEIVCGTIARPGLKSGDINYYRSRIDKIFDEYNGAIKEVCGEKNCRVADIAANGFDYETLDGSHPTALGHLELARAWGKCLGREIE